MFFPWDVSPLCCDLYFPVSHSSSKVSQAKGTIKTTVFCFIVTTKPPWLRPVSSPRRLVWFCGPDRLYRRWESWCGAAGHLCGLCTGIWLILEKHQRKEAENGGHAA
jgi:hypothetical protein